MDSIDDEVVKDWLTGSRRPQRIDRDFKELEYKGVSVVVDYQEWLLTAEGKKWKQTSKLEKSNPPIKEPVKVNKETKEDKLKKLKDLYDKKLISKEVYEKQQLEILSE